jgi:hypothetical protein
MRPDSAKYNVFISTLTGSPVTIYGPTNGVDGRKIVFRLVQDVAGSRSVTWDTAGFAFGADIPSVTLSTTAGKMDYVGAIYDAITGKWNIVSAITGF